MSYIPRFAMYIYIATKEQDEESITMLNGFILTEHKLQRI